MEGFSFKTNEQKSSLKAKSKDSWCFLNGKIIPLKKAGISPLDLGVMRGYTLLEVLRTYNGKIFALDDHYERLKNGVNFLHLKIPLTKNKLEETIYRLIKINRLKEAKIKIILSAGVSDEDFKIPEKQTLFIETEQLKTYPSFLYEKGIKLVTLNYKRTNPQIKIANYIEAIRFHYLLEQKKASELLYVYDNKVYECSSSNIFIFKKNRLITPNHAVLPGVTRKIVLTLAQKRFKTIIRNVTLSELKKADEVFITSTTREILPVIQIDKTKIKNGQVGQNTKILMQDFQDYLQKKYFK